MEVALLQVSSGLWLTIVNRTYFHVVASRYLRFVTVKRQLIKPCIKL